MMRVLLSVGTISLLAINVAQGAGDPAAGKARSAACAGCHGANGQGIPPNPALAGKSEEEMLQAMKDYKSGKRHNAIMKGLVAHLSDSDMANLAAYYASLKKSGPATGAAPAAAGSAISAAPPAGGSAIGAAPTAGGSAIAAVPAAGDPAAGKAKAATCSACHGANGQGDPPNPALAGKSQDELAQAMKDYKLGKRNNAIMKGLMAGLSDSDMANLAAYYASLKK
jgi:cytochrome c553